MSTLDLIARDFAAGLDYSSAIPANLVSDIARELGVEMDAAVCAARLILAAMTAQREADLQVIDENDESRFDDCA
jgi:hypothetical protein